MRCVMNSSGIESHESRTIAICYQKSRDFRDSSEIDLYQDRSSTVPRYAIPRSRMCVAPHIANELFKTALILIRKNSSREIC